MSSVLITGANSGIGLEAARHLAGRGHHLVLAVRDRGRGEAARAAIVAEHPGATIDVATVDLADLDSVRALAASRPAIDVLVNNAGVGSAPLTRTREGVLLQFAANHLGHFLLTALLLPRLAAGREPRVVTVGSGFGRRGRLALDNLDGRRGYGQTRAYAQSKLANSLFAAELDRRLRAAGSPVKSVLAHPGVAATEMQQKPTGAMGLVSRAVSALLGRPAANGALPTVLAATGEVASGDIVGPGRRWTDPPRREPRWPSFDDRDAARALWERSEALAGVAFLIAAADTAAAS